ncbi:MAG: hypothetical protein LBK73_15515 [Treponema sp.]|nr:hypothetical protein [Treponema sp.]
MNIRCLQSLATGFFSGTRRFSMLKKAGKTGRRVLTRRRLRVIVFRMSVSIRRLKTDALTNGRHPLVSGRFSAASDIHETPPPPARFIVRLS